jgi:integrase
MMRNPARGLKRPKLLEANEVVPYSPDEIIRIISACDFSGRLSYERLRARAMVLLMRFAGLRISDVVALSRDHVNGDHLKKRAVKNRRWIQVELPAEALRALEMLPRPKAATQDSRRYFSGEQASLASLVKGAWRTLKAVFKLAKVEGAHPHRFRHTLASELLAKSVPIAVVAAILADSEATIRKHYAKWTPEYQGLKDEAIRKIHGTHLAHVKTEAPIC